MTASGKIFRACLVSILISFCGAHSNAADVFDAVPADALFAVRVNNFEYTAGQVDQFLGGLAPMPNTASMMTRMQMANFLGDPNLSGINMQGQVAVFATALQKEVNGIPKIFIGGIIPVTDYKALMSSNPTATKADANGIGTIGPMNMLIAQNGNFAVLAKSNEYGSLANILKAAKGKNLAAVLPTAKKDAAAKARIWAYVNVQKGQQLFGPMLFSQMEKAMTVKDANMAQMAEFMTVYMNMIKTLLNETKEITIAANPKADSLGISGTLTAAPNTDMAKMLTISGTAKGSNKLLGYVPDNSFEMVTGRIDKPFLINMYSKCLDLMSPVFGPKFTPEEKNKFNKLIADSVNPLGTDFMLACGAEANSTPPFSAIYVFDVADAAAFKKSMKSWTDVIDAPYMQDLLKRFGFDISYKIKENAEQYKGVSIDEAEIAMKTSDPNSMISQMVVKMYGKALQYKMAAVNGLGFWTMGADADGKIKTLIDTAKAGGPKGVSGEVKKAMAILPDSNQAEFFGTYNYLRAMQMSAGLMPGLPFDANALKQMETKSDIAFNGNIGNGEIAFNAAIPKQHILEIKSAIEMIARKPKTAD